MTDSLSNLFDVLTVFFTDVFISNSLFSGLCILSVCFAVVFYFMWFWER